MFKCSASRWRAKLWWDDRSGEADEWSRESPPKIVNCVGRNGSHRYMAANIEFLGSVFKNEDYSSGGTANPFRPAGERSGCFYLPGE